MKLNVQSRELTGKKVKQLRNQDIIPGVIYGKRTKEAILVSFPKNEFLRLFKKAGQSTPVTISGDSIDQLVLIHEIQVDPVSDFLMHVDFLAVSKDEKVVASIPLILIGESNIEKLGEGKIQLLQDTVEVEAFPQDLPHEINIDISNIQKMSDVIFIKDLNIGTKAEIVEDLEQAIVTVVAFADEVEEETPAVAEGEVKEGEVKEGEDKKGEAKVEEKK